MRMIMFSSFEWGMASLNSKNYTRMWFVQRGIASAVMHISRGGKEERTRTRTRTRFLYSFPHDFGTTNHHAAEIKDNKVSEFHPVSRATTPGGPNPLHN
ncbi:hypothetical protein Lal_00034224 [Lupinus albus]|nr:hypothetical protein Lal_00034224 [Lupinus albus]